jgi:hypothetical protein
LSTCTALLCGKPRGGSTSIDAAAKGAPPPDHRDLRVVIPPSVIFEAVDFFAYQLILELSHQDPAGSSFGGSREERKPLFGGAVPQDVEWRKFIPERRKGS